METIDDVRRAVDDMRPAQLVDTFTYVAGRCIERGVFDGEGLEDTMMQLERRVGIRKPIARHEKRKR
jgi:hypothetical protein